jgi:hypothetical protein
VVRLVDLLDGVRAWPGETEPDFTAEDWHRAICVARRIQNTDRRVVEEALREYSMVLHSAGPRWERAFILLRLVFNLPQDAPVGERKFFLGAWLAPDVDGRVNLGWPISWSDGVPCFVAGVPAGPRSGPPYDAAGEYKYMLDKYPFRDLKAWLCDGEEGTTQPQGESTRTGAWPASTGSSRPT